MRLGRIAFHGGVQDRHLMVLLQSPSSSRARIICLVLQRTAALLVHEGFRDFANSLKSF